MISRLLRRAFAFGERYLRASGLVLYAFTFGLASSRRRLLIWKLAREAGYEPLVRRLPVVPIEAVTRSSTSVVLPFPDGVDGNVSLTELLVLARTARETAPRAVFEIGTFDGRTTATIAANVSEDAIVYTLDLPRGAATALALAPEERKYVEKESSGARVQSSPFAARVRQLYGDSAAFDFEPYRVDLVFVDGSHAYDYVVNDSLRALAMLRDGQGVIFWHDYGEWDGVTRALNELRARDGRFAGLEHVSGTTLARLVVRGSKPH